MLYKSNSCKGNKNFTLFSFMALLGCSGVFWLADQAIEPVIAQAAIDRVSLIIDRQIGESYKALISRAEVAARAAAQRRFDSDILINQVSVIVIGSNQGLESPILSLDVTRNQWRSRPDPKQWAKYFPSAQALLRLDQPGETATTSTPPSPPASTAPSSPSSPDRSNSPQRPPGIPGPARPTGPGTNPGSQSPGNSSPTNPGSQPPSNSSPTNPGSQPPSNSSPTNPGSQPPSNSSPTNPGSQPPSNSSPAATSGQPMPMVPELPDLPGIPQFPGIP